MFNDHAVRCRYTVRLRDGGAPMALLTNSLARVPLSERRLAFSQRAAYPNGWLHPLT